MKGGKRLTEEERTRIIRRLRTVADLIADMLPFYANDLRDDANMIERDDEPEYCIWEEHSVFKGFFHPSCEENRASHYPGVDDIKFCPYCGKPVKGEP